ncbi:MAG: hypothetical protein JST54_22360 [Deltaproteobacteria bacterium]|nr:hypothetical protein [Deltaproteobacteria bacterium]
MRIAAMVGLGALCLACSGSSSSSSSSSGGSGSAGTTSTTSTTTGGSSGSGGSSGTSGSVTAAQACTDYANAFCTKYSTCVGTTYFDAVIGSVADCNTRVNLLCTNSLAATGSGITPSLAETCVAAYSATTCEQALDHDPPAACQFPPGTVQNGAACAFASQCASLNCVVPDGGGCGNCAPAGAIGDSCSSDDGCPYGSTCLAGTCSSFAGDGGACGAGVAACPFRYSCSGSAGAQQCLPWLTSAGTGCGDGGFNQDCDFTAGLFCDPVHHVCNSIDFADAGDPCGFSYFPADGGDSYVACSGGSQCVGASYPTLGTCTSQIADGQPCATDGGTASCQLGASCVNGTCAVPNASTCP